jgi:DNA-binding transcriptional LysR family regulator
MLDPHRLRLLRELSYRHTIAAVAEALAYTPSAVSQQLAALEREAGLPLLERTGRQVRLNAAARTLVAHAEAVLDELERAEAALAAARTTLTGSLRIGAFPSAAQAILPEVLVCVGRDHPGLELTVTDVDPVHAAELLRAGDLDVALTHDYDRLPHPQHPALTSQVVLTEPMYLASLQPPDNPDAPVASFADHPWVMGTAGNLCRLATERICHAAGFPPRIRHQVDDFPTVLALVAAGQGAAIVPHLATLKPTPGVVLTPLPDVRRIRLTHRRGAATHPAITAFSAALDRVLAVHRSRVLTDRSASPSGQDAGDVAPPGAGRRRRRQGGR